MVTYDARPSAFTQIATTGDWEFWYTAAGIEDGVDGFASFQPSLDIPGRNAVISAGDGIIKGQLWRCDAPVSTPIPGASASNRIDRLTLRLTRTATTSPTVVQPNIITGTPSGSPVEPPLVQTPTGIWDIPICSWTSTSAGALTTLNDERILKSDTVHSMSSLLTNGWSVRTGGYLADYYMKSQYVMHVDFELNHSATSGTSQLTNALPQVYWPAHPQDAVIGWFGTAAAGAASPALGYNTAGVLTAFNLPTGTSLIQFAGDFPLY